VRLVLALVVGAATAALAALILGEYEMTGWTPYLCGVAFGLVVAEVVTSIGRRSGPAVAVACALLAAGGMVWAAWISSGRDWSYVPGTAWVGVALAGVLAVGWAARR
jgi:hypothetical protein